METFKRTYFAVTCLMWRKHNNLALREVEEMTGISAATLNRIELDERVPTILELERLCDLMSERPSSFFRSDKKVVNRD